MSWTPHLEEQLRTLDARQGDVLDRTFGLQIRIQLVAQNVLGIREHHETSSPITALYLDDLSTQIRGLEASIPPDLWQSGKSSLKNHGISASPRPL